MNLYKITVDSKEDQEAFIDKFGLDEFNKFNKLKGRMKNNGISTDLTWHVKNTDPDDMDDMLFDLENRKTEKNNIGFKYEDERWKVLQPLDWQTAMNLGEGTVWCITGRYETDEVKPSQAKEYFNRYLNDNYTGYYFIWDKKTGKKYCLCPTFAFSLDAPDEYDLWDASDVKMDTLPDFPLVKGLPDIGHKGDESVEYDGNNLVSATNVKEINIPEGTMGILKEAFKRSQATLEKVVFPSTLTSIGREAFYRCRNLKEVVFNGNQEIGIGYYTFCGIGITHIVLPRIPEENKNTFMSFCYCPNLESVDCGNTEVISKNCFYYCRKLKDVNFRNVKEIENKAFMFCDLSREIHIPGSVKYIGYEAFAGNPSLKKIVFDGDEIPKLSDEGIADRYVDLYWHGKIVGNGKEGIFNKL